jgi:predicted PurR-regulated permease PerM
LITAAAAVIVIAGLKAASGIVGPLMLAVSLTIVFHPLRIRLEHRLPSWAASIVVLVCAYVLILLLVVSLIVAIGRLAVLVPSYASELNGYAQDVGDWLAKAGVGSDQVAAAEDAADAGRLVGLATDVLSSTVAILSDLFFLVALLLFLAFDSAKVSDLAAGAREEHAGFVDAMTSFAHGTRSYLLVTTAFGLIVAVVDTGLLWAMGVPAAFVWGVLAFVTNFIPNIGFVIGLVPPALIGLLEGGPGLMLAVIVMYSVVNVIIQSVIQPRVVGQAVGLSTTLTFVSLVFWAWVLGPLGALLAVPMSLFFRAVLVEMDPEASWVTPLVSGRPEARFP